MATEGAGLTVKLHPLAIMNAADQHARLHANAKDKKADDYLSTTALGALFGRQSGHIAEVTDCLEITFDQKTLDQEGVINMNHDNFVADVELYKEVFPDSEILGWYRTGTGKPTKTDLIFHKQFKERGYNEAPLFMQLDPSGSSKGLPLSIFTAEVRIVQNAPVMTLIENPFSVVTDEAERITVDHVVKTKVDEGKGSVLTPHYLGTASALRALALRLTKLKEYLTDARTGKIERDQATLRSIKAICNRLPAMESEHFTEDFMKEYNDALLVTYLATMSKGAATMNSLATKFSTAFEGGGGRGMGLGHFL